MARTPEIGRSAPPSLRGRESSTNIAMVSRYARAPKGERAHGKAPRNWGNNVTLISSITLAGMGPSMSIEGPSDRESFGLYLNEVVLRAKLSPGLIVVMDNLSVHKKNRRVRELWSRRGGAASCGSCQPTRPSSTPLSKRSPRSREHSGRRKRAASRRSSKPRGRRCAQSPMRTLAVSSRTVATSNRRSTLYENCFSVAERS